MGPLAKLGIQCFSLGQVGDKGDIPAKMGMAGLPIRVVGPLWQASLTGLDLTGLDSTGLDSTRAALRWLLLGGAVKESVYVDVTRTTNGYARQ